MPPPLLGYRVGRTIKVGGAACKSAILRESGFARIASYVLFALRAKDSLTSTVAVPPAKRIAADVAIAIFVFVHPISFKAPSVRVRIELPTAAPLAAVATTVVASPTGAACTA